MCTQSEPMSESLAVDVTSRVVGVGDHDGMVYGLAVVYSGGLSAGLAGGEDTPWICTYTLTQGQYTLYLRSTMLKGH